MSTFELGQTLSVPLRITNDGTTPADLTTCVATWTKPDGTGNHAGTVDHPGTGEYLGLFAGSDQAGRWRCTFTGTGTYSGALPWSDVVDVWPSDPRLIISLADAKAEMNHVTSFNDDELRLYIAAATPVIEEIVGAVLASTEVETFNGGKTAVLLSERASAITSVTVDGVALSASEYVADLDSGIVYAGSSSSPTCFTYGRQNVVVTYTAGGSSIDPNIVLAARVVVAHLYQNGQQARRGKNQPDTTVLPSGFAVPTRAIELCEPSAHRRMPGFA